MIKENHSLTDEQIQLFKMFGFLVRRNVFSPEEIHKINDEFDHRLSKLKAEADPSEEPPSNNNWPNRNPHTPFIASLLEDPRIYVPSEQLVGENSVPIHSNANSYSISTQWHPDTEDTHLLMLKNVMYLQPTTGDHGALRVIPGSHKNPLHEDLLGLGLDAAFHKNTNQTSKLNEFKLRGEDIPSYIFNSQPGDLIMFNQRTWHAAFGGYEDRRTCTYNFYQNPESDEEKAEMRKQIDAQRSWTSKNKKIQERVGSQYDPSWLANSENNPRRERWIKWLEAWGFVDAFKI